MPRIKSTAEMFPLISLHSLTIMTAINHSESLSLHEVVSSVQYSFTPYPALTLLEHKIFVSLFAPEDPSYYVRAKTPVSEVPESLRPHLKTIRIRASDVFEAYVNRFPGEWMSKSVSLSAVGYSRRAFNVLGNAPNNLMVGMNPLVRERRVLAAEAENQEMRFLSSKAATMGLGIRKVLRVVNPSFPWIIASPDGVIFDGLLPVAMVEIKFTRGSPFWDSAGPMIREKDGGELELIPRCKTWYQAMITLAVTNLEWCLLVSASQSGERLELRVERDEEAITDMLTDCFYLYFEEMLPLIREVAAVNGISE